jgi:hypothetical protein
MKYTGKLFGKVGKTYIPLILTSDEVDAMERDKARIDWLADPENAIGNVQLPVGAVTENIGSLRDAIDAAMSGNYEKNAPMVEPGYSENETSPSVDAKENPMKYCDMCSIPSICSERRKCRYVETPAKEKALGPSDATACSPSDTPETDALADEEMGYRGPWCDKARKAEAALDALEDLTRELAATKKTLGTLIAWSVLELGEQNTQRLLDMMSSENAGGMAAGADGPPMPSERKA